MGSLITGTDLLVAGIYLVVAVPAIWLGSPLTAWVFARVDSAQGSTGPQGVAAAGRVLRGGAWIGMLERAAVYSSILLGWPEGIAVAIAIKGLGRYQELRTSTPGAAERFIIGTFTSMLFAVACALIAQFIGVLLR